MIMTMKNKFLISLLTIATVGACTYDFPEQAEPSFGDADFTKIVSVGNSLTAGFMDNALYTAGQNNSFAAIFARQAAVLGGGEFSVPTVNSANGCSNPAGGCTQGRFYLKYSNIATGAAGPFPTAGDGGASLAPYTGSKTALNNWGVPGVTIQTALLPATGGPASANPFFNPFYARIASNPGVSTLIGDAAASLGNGGTFFTFWLGNNDVLGYATGGASNPALLTSQGAFQTAFNGALNAMLSAKADAEGAVANIPNVTSIPFFSTVAYNPVVFLTSNPTHVATVAQLNSLAAYGGFNAALQGLATAGAITQAEADKRKVVFKTGTNSASGANAVVITDESLTNLAPLLGGINPALAGFGQVRQATSTDLITLTAGAVIPTGVGVSTPMGDQYVLIPAEQTEIQTAITGFNTTIASAVAAQSARLVLIDANAILADIKAGKVSINGSTLSASITPPFGAFSLDGVHPNQRGSAYMANKIIEAVNAKWGAKIPLCNPNDFVGNALPIP
jgi:lysophospholipase L1-like esterase